MIKHVRSLGAADSIMEKLKESWGTIKKSDSDKLNLACLIDSKNRVVTVFDYEGKELAHNPNARSVRFADRYY